MDNRKHIKIKICQIGRIIPSLQEHVLTITRAGIHCVPVGGALHRSNGCGGREGGGRGGDGGGDPVV